jgi:hypothetical protein
MQSVEYAVPNQITTPQAADTLKQLSHLNQVKQTHQQLPKNGEKRQNV